MVKTRSLYLTWPWIRTGSWRTDRQTDRIPIANTRSHAAVLAGAGVARKTEPKRLRHPMISSDCIVKTLTSTDNLLQQKLVELFDMP